MRYHKCQYCDKSGQKSIDIQKDDYIKTEDKKYYHITCYKTYLALKKKLSDSQIDIKIQDIQQLMAKEMEEEKDKDKLIEWLEQFYNANIPTYIFMKINDVIQGKNKLIQDEVDCVMLLEIYEKMSNYLNKVATKKHFAKIDQRMSYDLSIVLNNINEYKKYKAKQSFIERENKEIDNLIQSNSTVKKIEGKEDKKQEFNIVNAMQDLLL